MRLLILTPEYDGSGGGIMTFYQALIPAVQAQGVSVRVIEGSASYTAVDKSPRLSGGVQVETLELERLRQWHARFSQFAATPGLRQHLAAAWAMWEQANFGEDADVIEACDWGLLFVPASLAGRPLVTQCHGSVGQIAQHDPLDGEETQGILALLLERAILAGVGTIQTPSRSNAAYWRDETGRHVSPMLPAWVFPAPEPPKELQRRGLVVGRLQRWKGPQVLCAALELMGHGRPEIDWIGRDTPWGSHQRSTSSSLANKFADVWGKGFMHQAPLPAKDVRSRQACALFNLVPSTWDVFNFTAVEAMASGRPTIISSAAGASELVEDGVNGYLFPSGNAEKLASTIDRVLTASRAELVEVGRAAQETILRALNPLTIASQRVAAYHSAINACAEPRGLAVSESVAAICRPSDRPAEGDSSFLNQMPLRALVRHVAGRVEEKLIPRSAWKATP